MFLDSLSYFPHRRIPDALYIVIVKDLACPITVHAISDLSSDHDLVLITVQSTLDRNLKDDGDVIRLCLYHPRLSIKLEACCSPEC